MNSLPARRQPVEFLLPGDPATPTGGYRYDTQVISGLRAAGHLLRVTRLAADFPYPDQAALQHARQVFESCHDGSVVIIDGLAFGVLPATLLARQARRLILIALVHHPLWLETGVTTQQAQLLADSERVALGFAHRVVVTSRITAGSVQALGVPADKIIVAPPGVEPTEPPTRDDIVVSVDGGGSAGIDSGSGSGSGSIMMLAVATLTPRKGHLVLLDALEQVMARTPARWHLSCIGATDRHAGTAAAVAGRIAQPPLHGQVTVTGVVSDAALRQYYRRADLFVSAAWWEGYAMAAAQALAYGLPVIGTSAGAFADTVPASASLQSPPGDSAALADSLVQFLDHPALRERLANGARVAASGLPRWQQTVAQFDLLIRQAAGA